MYVKRIIAAFLLSLALCACQSDPIPDPDPDPNPAATTWQGGGATPAAYVTTNTAASTKIQLTVGDIRSSDKYGIGTVISNSGIRINSLNAGERITSVGVCWARDVARPDLSAYTYVEATLTEPISTTGQGTFGELSTYFAIPGDSYNYCLFARSSSGTIYYSDPKSYTIPAVATDDNVQQYPVIFHVLYSNDAQNVRKEFIDAYLVYANLALRNKMTPTTPIENYAIPPGADTHIRLVAATTDPEGLTLPVAGIDRRPWSQSSMDAEAFLTAGTTSDQTAAFWDPYTYVNVWLFDFKGEQSTAGMALRPFVPTAYGLAGLTSTNSYMGVDRPTNMKPGICLNSNASTVDYAQTLGHEAGHYFGLLHAFSTSVCGDGNDYCDDTPDYVLNVDSPQYRYVDDPRTACDGTEFISYNIMDYYGLGLQFSADQVTRTSHAQQYGFFIPGSDMGTRTRADIPAGSDMTFPKPQVIRSSAVREIAPTAVTMQQVD